MFNFLKPVFKTVGRQFKKPLGAFVGGVFAGDYIDIGVGLDERYRKDPQLYLPKPTNNPEESETMKTMMAFMPFLLILFVVMAVFKK